MVKIKVGFVWPGAIAWVPNKRTILVINEDQAKNTRLIAHELCHINQAKRLGILYIPTYILKWIQVGFNYYENPMEVEARKAEKDPNYTAWAKEVIQANK